MGDDQGDQIMGRGKLTDPADNKTPEQKQAQERDEAKALSIKGLSMADLQAVPQSAAAVVHPFDGYPMEDIEIGMDKGKPVITKKTFIVVLSPSVYVHQDPSGKNVHIKGKDGVDHIKTIPTTHNRVVWDTSNKHAIDIVFDRKMELEDGNTVSYAVVSEHWARAQLIYEYDAKASGIRVNRDYLLLDTDQVSRLRKVFEIIINPRLKTQVLADKISNGDDE
jgi:hypothetical protein